MKWFNAEGEMLFSRRFFKHSVRRFRTAPLGKVRGKKKSCSGSENRRRGVTIVALLREQSSVLNF